MTSSSVFRPLPVCDVGAVDPRLSGGVFAIGNFDGMHRGHQAVFEETVRVAEAAGVAAAILTFEPHPRSVFKPESPVFRLTPPDAKARIGGALGLSGLVVTPFTAAFAAESAARFVETVIAGALAARHVVVGWDFQFGAGREGTAEFLAAEGAARGFGVSIVAPFADEGGETVSSSRVRAALAAGDVAAAAGLLGYRWFFEGEVGHGDKRGRTIGYPTANIRLAPECGLAQGIYAVIAEVDGVRHPGVASWGRRPTFDDGAPVFETFLFDFSGDLYGKVMRVTPLAFLRSEMKFASVSALVEQMDRDSAEARAVQASLAPLTPLDRALLFD